MLMGIYDIWKARQYRITPLKKLELEIIELKNALDVKNKQINNIYELLETLTNESKTKYKNLDESNNVS